MNYLALALLVSVGLTACSEAPPEKLERSSLKTKDYNGTPTAANAEGGKLEKAAPPAVVVESIPSLETRPVVSPAVTPAVVTDPTAVTEADMVKFLAMAPFDVEGLPKANTDFATFEMKIKADPLITHFSYKVGTAEDCKIASGYLVVPIATPVKISVEKLPDGPVAVCLLRFLGPGKLWQKTESATVISWQKIPLVRTITSQFSEWDYDCNKNLITKTVVKINGNKSTYSWSKDPKAQGCNRVPFESGEDTLSITSSDATAIKGYRSYQGGVASGWYSFEWKNKERTGFMGSYGYGEPGTTPSGPWISVVP